MSSSSRRSRAIALSLALTEWATLWIYLARDGLSPHRSCFIGHQSFLFSAFGRDPSQYNSLDVRVELVAALPLSA